MDRDQPPPGPTTHAAINRALNSAAALARAGRPHEAVAALQAENDALKHPAGYDALGVLHMQIGSVESALGCFDMAVGLAPGFADAHSHRGAALQQLGRLDDALAAYDSALRAAPNHLGALMGSANLLKRLDRHPEAIAMYSRVLALKGDSIDAVLGRAATEGALNDYDAALRDFDLALRLDPRRSEAILGRLAALTGLGRFQEAISGADRFLAANPANVEAEVLKSQILLDLDRLPEALRLADSLLRRGLGHSRPYHVLSAVLWALGRRAEAIALAEEAARIYPTDVKAHRRLAGLRLASGDFRGGWDEFEFRDRRVPPDIAAKFHALAPQWNGEPIAGRTIFVFAEQGLGDTLQFIRFLIGLERRGASVKALVQPALRRLVRSLPASIDWVDSESEVGRVDYQVSLLSLPRLFGTEIATIPAAVPYLAPPPDLIATWRERLNTDGFRVGIVWQGNPRFVSDQSRSAPLQHYAPLAAVPGVRLVSLQGVFGLNQMDALPAGMAVELLGEKISDNPDGMTEIAAVMASLDLVVCSDTAIAHLAGALGRPVWIALSVDPDWRWLLDRNDCPWYPTAHLFRQKRRGDWAGVFSEMARQLADRLRVS